MYSHGAAWNCCCCCASFCAFFAFLYSSAASSLASFRECTAPIIRAEAAKEQTHRSRGAEGLLGPQAELSIAMVPRGASEPDSFLPSLRDAEPHFNFSDEPP